MNRWIVTLSTSSTSGSEGKKVPLAVVFYAAVPFIVLSIVLIIALVYLIYKRRREQFEKKSEQPAGNKKVKHYPYLF